jgi:hypothetical protein
VAMGEFNSTVLSTAIANRRQIKYRFVMVILI